MWLKFGGTPERILVTVDEVQSGKTHLTEGMKMRLTILRERLIQFAIDQWQDLQQ
jgi:hypothetical protein